MSEVNESGRWKAGYNHKTASAYIESNDFYHDARLIINGDFKNAEQTLNYAKEIAMRLNSYLDQKYNTTEKV